jgi:MFS transporter, SP family, xylose:H+ symportor
MKVKGMLLKSAIVAALGGLLFGFDVAVISGAMDAIKNVFNLTNQSLGFTVASAMLGTIIGAIAIGRPADIYGRHTMLIVLAVFYFISAIGCAFAGGWHSFLFFRFLGGLAVGGSSVVSPMYIAEISPAKIRGRLVAITQFNIVLGILLAFFSNYIIANIAPNDTAWRWMFGVQAFPAAIFCYLLFLIPMSPRWLIAKNMIDQAMDVFRKLGSTTKSAEEEIAAIKASLDIAHHDMRERFYCMKYAMPISLAFLIAVFNQLSGIGALLYYAPQIFKMAGAGGNSALLQTVVVGGTNLIFTVFALIIIDHFGRKKLMFVGSIGYIVSLGVIAWSFFHYHSNFNFAGSLIVLFSMLLFIASHAFGQGAVIWVFISEIFPNRVRARGQALGSFTHWVMCAIVTWTFPVIASISGGYAFAFFAAMMVLQLLFVIFLMPETKGIPLEQIQKKLHIE